MLVDSAYMHSQENHAVTDRMRNLHSIAAMATTFTNWPQSGLFINSSPPVNHQLTTKFLTVHPENCKSENRSRNITERGQPRFDGTSDGIITKQRVDKDIQSIFSWKENGGIIDPPPHRERLAGAKELLASMECEE